MADIEDLQIQFQMLLCQGSMDVVKPIAERLGIEKANWKEKKSQMVGLLCKFVDGELDKKETDTQRVQMLQDLIGRCKEMIAKESGDDTAEKEVEAVEGKIKELREAKAKLGKEAEILKKIKTMLAENSSYFGLTSALRRQFKITGQIGEPNQKDKLNYTSLVRQIEAGIEQGFT
jgi:hypothetical protein